MGLFGKAKNYVGVEDKNLLANGILAQGNVHTCDPADPQHIELDLSTDVNLVTPDWPAILGP